MKRERVRKFLFLLENYFVPIFVLQADYKNVPLQPMIKKSNRVGEMVNVSMFVLR